MTDIILGVLHMCIFPGGLFALAVAGGQAQQRGNARQRQHNAQKNSRGLFQSQIDAAEQAGRMQGQGDDGRADAQKGKSFLEGLVLHGVLLVGDFVRSVVVTAPWWDHYSIAHG